ncbi:hypothetical protein UlMin_035327 [Ulmus minor]
MTELNNGVRVTRGAKKRAAVAANINEQSPCKKRVVLGELKNLGNDVAPVDLVSGLDQRKPKRITQTKKVKNLASNRTTAIDLQKGDGDSNDPQMCGPYISDIFDYLHKMEVEKKRRPSPDYLEKVQKDVTANMRGVLVDWLVEVAEEYKLGSETLYLSVSYIDRFLSLNTISRQKLQLLGVSSLLIASKYEEITPPGVVEFCYITDNTYTKDEVVKMEANILKSLKFEMGNPTIKSFLRRVTDAAKDSDKINHMKLEFLGFYLAELSLLDFNCVKFLPSQVAASVVFLANFIICPDTNPWCPILQECSGYKSSDLRECVLNIHDLYLGRRGGSLHAIRDKYKHLKFKRVANMPCPPEIPASYFKDDKPKIIILE